MTGGFANPDFSASGTDPFILPSPLDSSKFLQIIKREGGNYFDYAIGTISAGTQSWSNQNQISAQTPSGGCVVYDRAGSSSGDYKFYIIYI